MDELKTQLSRLYNNLPKNVQSLLESGEIYRQLDLLASKYFLDENDQINLTDETLLVILGINLKKDFLFNVRTVLSLPYEKAPLLVKDIEENIFRGLDSWFNEIAKFENEEKMSVLGIVKEVTPAGVVSVKDLNQVSIRSTQKSAPPSNLPVVEPHLEPMIYKKEESSFLPPLSKKTPTIDERPGPIAPKIPTPSGSQPVNLPKKPDVTSALAKEIGNLLGQNTPPNNQSLDSPQKTTLNSTPVIPTPSVGAKPEDKLSGMVKMPRVEVEMIKKTPGASDQKPAEDPYREPI